MTVAVVLPGLPVVVQVVSAPLNRIISLRQLLEIEQAQVQKVKLLERVSRRVQVYR